MRSHLACVAEHPWKVPGQDDSMHVDNNARPTDLVGFCVIDRRIGNGMLPLAFLMLAGFATRQSITVSDSIPRESDFRVLWFRNDIVESQTHLDSDMPRQVHEQCAHIQLPSRWSEIVMVETALGC
jgi:hypothetical protein